MTGFRAVRMRPGCWDIIVNDTVAFMIRKASSAHGYRVKDERESINAKTAEWVWFSSEVGAFTFVVDQLLGDG